MTIRILALIAALAPPLGTAAGSNEAGEAGVPAPIASEVAARAAERGVPPAEALAPIAEAAQRGVPADLVAAKVLEGLSKGIPPARIAAVARDLTERLARSDGLLGDAKSAGLAPPGDRRAALLDLAAALGAGVRPPDVESLVAAARAARGGRADSVVSAAHALGELARRGVPPPQAMALGLAIARTGPRPAAEIPALFESWRAEGGKDPRGFLDEATRRIESGRKLDDLVDVFGESPNRVAADRGKANGKGENDHGGLIGSDVGKEGADEGVGPAERANAARGAVPGLDDKVRGQARGGGPKPKR